MPPFVHLLVYRKGLTSLRHLRDDDLRAALVHLLDDPVAVKSLVRKQGVERNVLDQGRNADRVIAIGGHQDEAHEIAERVHKGQNLGRPAAFRLAYGLALSPPFAPIP